MPPLGRAAAALLFVLLGVDRSAAGARERIPRHAVDVAWAREGASAAAKILPLAREAALRNLSHASILQSNAEAQASHLAVSDPSSQGVCAGARLGAQAAAALFAGATAREPTVEVRLGEGPPVRVPAHVPGDLAEIGAWRRGFFLGLVLRNEEALEVLSRVPTDLLRVSTTKADPFAYLFADALKGFRREDPGAPARLLAALKATEGRQEIASQEFVLEVATFQMELLYRLMLQDAAAFNDTLHRALQAHRRFWSPGDRGRDPQGYVAWGLVALASLAHDQGLPVEVESDYLPLDLVRGRCRAGGPAPAR